MSKDRQSDANCLFHQTASERLLSILHEAENDTTNCSRLRFLRIHAMPCREDRHRDGSGSRRFSPLVWGITERMITRDVGMRTSRGVRGASRPDRGRPGIAAPVAGASEPEVPPPEQHPPAAGPGSRRSACGTPAPDRGVGRARRRVHRPVFASLSRREIPGAAKGAAPSRIVAFPTRPSALSHRGRPRGDRVEVRALARGAL